MVTCAEDDPPEALGISSSSSSIPTLTNTDVTTINTTDTSISISTRPVSKPHARTLDPRWSALRHATSTSPLTLTEFVFLRRLGSGDIGSVFLVELKCASGCRFAAKVMDKEELENRNKKERAKIEREILEMLDHPFLPTLYATLESPKWAILLTEFCPGGDLHVLRQLQPDRRFIESVVRFYISEVIVALEYLHMKGIVYRDLKPENVLVQFDGHIKLTDFDLSLKCENSKSEAQIVSNENKEIIRTPNYYSFINSSCILPDCVVTPIRCLSRKTKYPKKKSYQDYDSIQIVTEPLDARSMSFVGTHEYLAPEIVSGQGHGNAVDWWTLGILIYELLYGVTPFKGADHDFTLENIVARNLEFPKEPNVSSSVKNLITKLLKKDPTKRMGSRMGATSIKRHTFFDGVNWALLRCTQPPFVPRDVSYTKCGSGGDCFDAAVEYY